MRQKCWSYPPDDECRICFEGAWLSQVRRDVPGDHREFLFAEGHFRAELSPGVAGRKVPPPAYIRAEQDPVDADLPDARGDVPEQFLFAVAILQGDHRRLGHVEKEVASRRMCRSEEHTSELQS